MGEFRCQVKTDSASGSELKLLQQPKVAVAHWRVRDIRLHEHFINFYSDDFFNSGVASAAVVLLSVLAQRPPVASTGHRFVLSPSVRPRLGRRRKKKKKSACSCSSSSDLELHSAATAKFGLLKCPLEESLRGEKKKGQHVFSDKNKSIRQSAGKFQGI